MPLLLGKPLPPFRAGLCAIAAPARWHQVLGRSLAAGYAWHNMIERVCWICAVGAGMIPFGQYARPKSGLTGAFGLQLGLVDQVIEGHSIGEYGSRNCEAALRVDKPHQLLRSLRRESQLQAVLRRANQ